jgi:hypothetical protein
MAHHPVLGFASNPNQPEAPYPGNAGLQSVLQALQPEALFPPGVQAVLGGHVHLFEAVSFATAQPPQIVSGNGGVAVDARLPSPFPPNATPAPGAIVDDIASTNAFGFVTMERDGARWAMIARDMRGAAMTACTLAARKVACVPQGGF